MTGTRLLLTAVALLILSWAVRAAGVARPLIQQPPPAPYPVGTTARASSDYLGSKACAECHEAEYAEWERSLHIRMTKPIAEATVLGDFSSGARLSAHGRRYEFGMKDGKPVVTATFGTAAPQTFAVDYTLGFKRYQGYLSTLPDGRMLVLPVFWHVETKRWLDWKEITPIPDGAHDLRQVWNVNCLNCHATNLAQGFDPATKTYRTTWTEMGIGCEACHGPGRRHVAEIEAWRQDPTLKPGGTLATFSPGNATARQTFDTCAYCHGNKQNVFFGFRAGDRYEDYALPFLISAPIPANDPQGEFWPDGRPSRFNRPQALMMSGCFKAGEIACTNCHAAHGSPYPFSLRVDITRGAEGDTLCTQCHEGYEIGSGASGAPATALSSVTTRSSPRLAHSFHAPDSEGSRCINCHMSDVNWRLLIRRRDHTFTAPVPEITARYGAPNACNTCHDDRSPEWAAKWMDQWWGDGERRRTALFVADTMYRAGSGDPEVVPDLVRLAVDRDQPAIVRASAVEFIEQLALGTAGSAEGDSQSQTSFVGAATGERLGGEPLPKGYGVVQRRSAPPREPVKLTSNQINALVGAASDPEAIVRAQAVNALLASGDRDRILAPLVARLVDSARVVRTRAAEALLSLGVARLPGQAGDALARAQDELAAALAEFPDVAANHAALGWLESERDRLPEAHAALDTAMRLDPRAARPLVLKGVIAARAEDYAQAIHWWKKARALEPEYPNLEAMIAEAEKRIRQGG